MNKPKPSLDCEGHSKVGETVGGGSKASSSSVGKSSRYGEWGDNLVADPQRGVQLGAAGRGRIEVTAKRNHCSDEFVSTDTSNRVGLHMRSSFGK